MIFTEIWQDWSWTGRLIGRGALSHRRQTPGRIVCADPGIIAGVPHGCRYTSGARTHATGGIQRLESTEVAVEVDGADRGQRLCLASAATADEVLHRRVSSAAVGLVARTRDQREPAEDRRHIGKILRPGAIRFVDLGTRCAAVNGSHGREGHARGIGIRLKNPASKYRRGLSIVAALRKGRLAVVGDRGGAGDSELA